MKRLKRLTPTEVSLLDASKIYQKSIKLSPKTKKRLKEWAKRMNKILDKPIAGRHYNHVIMDDLTTDDIHSPSHYLYGGLEVIEILRKKMTPEMFEGYLMGNLLAYIFRYKLKGNPLQDLEKARVYLNWLIEEIRRKKHES